MPQRCRNCDGCHEARRGLVIARISCGLDLKSNPAMLTLTSLPGSSWPATMRAWSSMVRYLRKSSPQLEYAAAKEEGSLSGMKHLHILLLQLEYTPQAEISAQWARLTGAHIVRIERLHSDRAASYVAKYVSKDLSAARKHVTFSAGWPKLPPSTCHAANLAELPPYGPSKVRQMTDRGGFVDVLRPGCDCWGTIHSTTLGEHLWLRSLMGPSPPRLAAVSAP